VRAWTVATPVTGSVTLVEDPEAHVLVAIKETFTAQRRNAETFEFLGNVIVSVNWLIVKLPELLIWNVRTVPWLTFVE
jgi:hypothetical protein